MIKRFFKDSLIYTFSGIITGGVSFIMLPFFTAYFSVEEYGIYDYLVVMGSFIGVTVALEISQGVARFIPEMLDNPVKKRLYASTSLWFVVTCFLVFLLSMIIFRRPLSGLFFDNKNSSNLLLVASVSYSIYAIVYLIVNQLRWELKSKESSIVSIVFSSISISSAIFYVYKLQLGVAGAFWGNITGGIFAIIIGFYFTRKSYSFTFSRKILKELLSFSLPLVISSAALFFANYVDRFAIKKLMTLTDLGIYAVGFRISYLVMLVMIGFQGALTPLIYKHYKEEETPRKLALLFRYFIVLSILIFSVLILFSSELINLMANKEYIGAIQVIPFLVLSVLFNKMYIFFPGLGIRKKTIIIAIINIGSAALNLILNFVLIPFWGISGAAIATCISAFSYLVVYVIFSQKYYSIPYETKKIITSSLIVLLIILPFNFLAPEILSIYFKIALLLLVLFIIFGFRLIMRSDVDKFYYQIKMFFSKS